MKRRPIVLGLLYLCLAVFAYFSETFFQALHRTSTSMQEIPATVSRQILVLANEMRAAHGAPPLEWEDHLALAADRHTREMLQLDYFEHESPITGNTHVWDRVEQTGINPRSVGECLYEAAGLSSRELPKSCIDAWLKSPGHRETLLDPKYNVGGVGVGRSGSVYRITMVFARP